MAVKIGCVGTLDTPDSNEVLELGNNTTQAEDRTFLQAVQSGDASPYAAIIPRPSRPYN